MADEQSRLMQKARADFDAHERRMAAEGYETDTALAKRLRRERDAAG